MGDLNVLQKLLSTSQPGSILRPKVSSHPYPWPVWERHREERLEQKSQFIPLVTSVVPWALGSHSQMRVPHVGWWEEESALSHSPKLLWEGTFGGFLPDTCVSVCAAPSLRQRCFPACPSPQAAHCPAVSVGAYVPKVSHHEE